MIEAGSPAKIYSTIYQTIRFRVPGRYQRPADFCVRAGGLILSVIVLHQKNRWLPAVFDDPIYLEFSLCEYSVLNMDTALKMIAEASIGVISTGNRMD